MIEGPNITQIKDYPSLVNSKGRDRWILLYFKHKELVKTQHFFVEEPSSSENGGYGPKLDPLSIKSGLLV